MHLFAHLQSNPLTGKEKNSTKDGQMRWTNENPCIIHDICQSFYPTGVLVVTFLHKTVLIGKMANTRQNSMNALKYQK